MKRKIIGTLVCSILIATAAIPIASTEKIELRTIFKVPNEKIKRDHLEYIPGEFFVKFKEGVSVSLSFLNNIMTTGLSSIDILNREFRVQNIEETFLSTIKKPKNPELFESIGLDRIYTFKLAEGIDVLDAVNAYEKDDYVESVGVNGIGNAFGPVFPNDSNFNLQWGLHNTGQTGGTSDADIDAPEAWEIEKGDSSIVVAIIDSGIDYNHPDLTGKVIKGYDFVYDDSDPMDDHYDSHGTHCAGIAGAATNNSIGVAGVDWNCQLMAVKAMFGNNGTIMYKTAALALVYAADNGADVISMSWGGTHSGIPVLKDAIDYAYNTGCVLVAAMGNYDSWTPIYPAAYNNTIAVGATQSDDTRWSSSNKGSHIDVVAPGADIYSTKRNNQYGYMSGTSMATPMVAGLAALLLAQDSTRINTEIRDIICKNADDQVGKPSEDTSGFDNYHGFGRINAFKALINKKVFLIGLINNVNKSGEAIIANAKMLISIDFKPFGINVYNSNNKIFLSKDYLGYVGPRFIIGFYETAIV